MRWGKTDTTTSARMASIRTTNTKIEKTVKSILLLININYKCNCDSLPGSPDFVLKDKSKAIFVHGCFWHRHKHCSKSTSPKRNSTLWEMKFKDTIARDKKNLRDLHKLGWETLVIWECELKNKDRVSDRIFKFFYDKM